MTSANIYSTYSNGRLHIAANKDYVGSVNVYRNWLTRFVTKISGFSTRIDFGGKAQIVNKKSYVKLLKKLGTEGVRLSNINGYNDFKQVLEKSTIPSGQMIRNAIDNKKQRLLTRRLATSILSGQNQRAIKMIAKGADIDRVYYSREGTIRKANPLAFDSDTQGLKEGWAYKFNVFKGSPIFHAAKLDRTEIVKTLMHWGADKEAVGEEYLFKRKIIGITIEEWDDSIDDDDDNKDWKYTVHTEDFRYIQSLSHI